MAAHPVIVIATVTVQPKGFVMETTSRLYPELVAEEIDLVIRPLDECALPVTDTRSAPAVPPVHVRPSAFGRPAEDFSFQRVATEVADHFWTQGWDPALENGLADVPAFATRVREVLAADFLTLAVRPLVQGLQDHEGATPEESYQLSAAALLADGLAAFAAAHPVAWHRIEVRLRSRIAAVVESLRRIRDDRAKLSTFFRVDPEARLTAMSATGDTHAGGRTVSILEFSDGTRVVYKPRPVDSEFAYADLCGFLRREFGTDFLAARVLRRPGYGYVEFVETDADAAVDLHQVGSLAALLYLLNARDMHFTNILSTSRGPLPVDLETLLHPYRQKSTGTPEPATSGYRILESSVFGTGVLPLVVTRPGRDGYVDVGYLGGGEVAGRGPFRRFRIVSPFRSDMRVEWDEGETPSTMRRDQVDTGTAARVRADAERMVEGFTETYELIRAHRPCFERAVRQRFARAEIRYIHNPTIQYSHCLRMLTGAAAATDVSLARGLTKRIGIASRNADLRLVSSECRQLWDTDIPFFLMRADAPEVTDGSDERRVVAAFPRSPLQQLADKLDTLSEKDLHRQVELIRVAFNAKLPDPHHVAVTAEVLAPPTAGPSPRPEQTDALRSLAGELGQQLVDGMVQDRFAHLPHTWLGPVASTEVSRPWPPGVLAYDLYTGRTGPALTLATLGVVLGDDALRDAAAAVFTPAARVLLESRYELRSIAQAGLGAFNGFAGTVWAMASAGRLTGDDELVAAARVGTTFLRDAGPQSSPGWFDIISGAVGGVLVRQVLDVDPDEAGREGVAACRYALAAGLVAQQEYSGLAHGLAGLLLLAARTYRITPDPIAAELAESVRREWEQHFSTPTGLRTNRSGERNHSDSWCNGTAGQLVALTEAVQSGLATEGELDPFVTSLREGSIATAATLCHGMLGLHDVLGRTERVSTGALADRVRELRQRITAHLDAGRLAAALHDPGSRYSYSPALMVGRAGIGWHLAGRISDLALPSPLGLEAPLTSPADEQSGGAR